MGNLASYAAAPKWRNPRARKDFLFLEALFGVPGIYVSKKGGLAIWTPEELQGKTIFKQEVVLESVMLKDFPSGEKGAVYLVVRAPVSREKQCGVTRITPNAGFDAARGDLWIRAPDLDTGVLMLKALLDYLLGRASLEEQPESFNRTLHSLPEKGSLEERVDFLKKIYSGIITDLKSLKAQKKMEVFSDEPWYALETAYYASNNPGSIALGNTENAQWYRRQAETPLLYPSPVGPRSDPNLSSGCMGAGSNPLGESSGTERLDRSGRTPGGKDREGDWVYGLPAPMAPDPSCKGACLDRFYRAIGLPQPREGIVPEGPKALGARDRTPVFLEQAYLLFVPRRRKASIERMSSGEVDRLFQGSHVARFEALRGATAPGGIPVIKISRRTSGGARTEYLLPSSPLNLGQAYALFLPKKIYEKDHKMETFETPLNLGLAKQLFQPRKPSLTEINIARRAEGLRDLTEINIARRAEGLRALTEINIARRAEGLRDLTDINIGAPAIARSELLVAQHPELASRVDLSRIDISRPIWDQAKETFKSPVDPNNLAHIFQPGSAQIAKIVSAGDFRKAEPAGRLGKR